MDEVVGRVVVEVIGDDESAHGMADQIDAWGLVIIGGVVVFQEAGAFDGFENKLPQLECGILQGLAPVVGEGEDGGGEVWLGGEIMAEFLDELGVDELQQSTGLELGWLASLVTGGVGVEGHAAVVAGPEVIDRLGCRGVLVLEFAAHDAGDEHNGVWGVWVHGDWHRCRDFASGCNRHST